MDSIRVRDAAAAVLSDTNQFNFFCLLAYGISQV
jgi:hypothetical protein